LYGTDAIDIFIESDPTGDGEDAPSLISVRVPYEREFARQIRELGAKWEDQSKEWKLYGSEELLKQVASLCKKLFPHLPRRRNRLVAARLTTHEGQVGSGGELKQLEVVARAEFVVNRTLKNYHLGQSLKWVKEFKQVVEVAATEEADSNASAARQSKFAAEVLTGLPELERVATEAFEALLVGRKEVAKNILTGSGIEN